MLTPAVGNSTVEAPILASLPAFFCSPDSIVVLHVAMPLGQLQLLHLKHFRELHILLFGSTKGHAMAPAVWSGFTGGTRTRGGDKRNHKETLTQCSFGKVMSTNGGRDWFDVKALPFESGCSNVCWFCFQCNSSARGTQHSSTFADSISLYSLTDSTECVLAPNPRDVIGSDSTRLKSAAGNPDVFYTALWTV